MSRTFLMDTDIGDIYLNSSGKSLIIDGVHKLKQDITESLLTVYDSNRNYGNKAQIGTIASDNNYLNEYSIEIDINDAIERLKAYQQKDIYLTEEEEIASIDSIQVESINRTKYVFFLELTNQSGTAISGKIGA